MLAVVRRDLRTALRDPAEVLNPLVFFLIVVTLFPIGISPIASELAPIAPGVVWIAALLSTLLSMDIMLRADHECGALEQMVLSSQPLFLLMLGKAIAHWLLSGLPLALMAPVLGLMLGLPPAALAPMVLALLLATPVLSLVGSIGAGLTVGLARGGVLITILILPLYVPVLILGTQVVVSAVAGEPVSGLMLWLGAAFALAVGLCPVAAAAGVQIAVSR